MTFKMVILAGASLAAIAMPAAAQDTAEPQDGDDIIVTAQRNSEKLQDVPIAVSAFSTEALAEQQIDNTSDLQLTLPNVTYTKTNLTSSSFTIRGIGDLCSGVTCDSATAIHMNDAPLFGTRLFEGEFYDLAQIEVLRGPQGTLFGRNATSGVVNIMSARPRLGDFRASGEVELGNYDSVKVQGMVNIPLGETLAARFAGYHLNRDGYTLNRFDGSRIDGRDTYGLRGSLRWEPGSGTTVDAMVQYFHEHDTRLRNQKQLCQRDVSAVIGCLNFSRDNSTVNYNAGFAGVLTSVEFFRLLGIPDRFGLESIYGREAFDNQVNPTDPREVNSDFTPDYFSEELIAQLRLEQDLGSGLTLRLNGNYQEYTVDSMMDSTLAVQDRTVFAPALNALADAAVNGLPGVPGSAAYFRPLANALIPQGPNGLLCASDTEPTGTGVFGGHSRCAYTPLDFDRSFEKQRSYSVEAIVSSDFDSPFNFLAGAIYSNQRLTENSYYLSQFAVDYFVGILGAFNAVGSFDPATGRYAVPPSYLATPTYRQFSDDLTVESYGLFGEVYFKPSDALQITLGARYNHDDKRLQARTTLANFLVPYGTTDAFATPGAAAFDADGGLAGIQPFLIREVGFSEWTGRAVIDYALTPDNLLYASYSRGYKSGGINPPVPGGIIPETFEPEFVNAFEIGSKNQFGPLQLNLTGFYYQYQDLQLSRIVSRTSVNDNVSADIYGVEAELIYRPAPRIAINVNASYLHTEVTDDNFISDTRDFGGGRADAVIIKDLTGSANCAVASRSGNVAGINGFVNAVNAGLGVGLRPTQPFPAGSGLASTGAFGICGALEAAASGGNPAVNPAAFGGVDYFFSGVPKNIRGNNLPGAPDYKFSIGVDYALPVGSMTLTPRVDYIRTGPSSGNIFNGPVNAISGYDQVNAQIRLDSADERWFVRAFVQNLFDGNATTGLYVQDQSLGVYTNVFTLEPRRFGIAAGFQF